MTNEDAVSAAAENMPGDERVPNVIEATLDRFLSTADESRAIGDPISHGDTLIIPTAEVVAIMGFGMGTGSGAGSAQEPMGHGAGGGGGGNAFSRPVAVIVAGPNGVEVQPVVDVTKIGLTLLTAIGFMIATVGRMSRRPRQ